MQKLYDPHLSSKVHSYINLRRHEQLIIENLTNMVKQGISEHDLLEQLDEIEFMTYPSVFNLIVALMIANYTMAIRQILDKNVTVINELDEDLLTDIIDTLDAELITEGYNFAAVITISQFYWLLYDTIMVMYEELQEIHEDTDVAFEDSENFNKLWFLLELFNRLNASIEPHTIKEFIILFLEYVGDVTPIYTERLIKVVTKYSFR